MSLPCGAGYTRKNKLYKMSRNQQVSFGNKLQATLRNSSRTSTADTSCGNISPDRTCRGRCSVCGRLSTPCTWSKEYQVSTWWDRPPLTPWCRRLPRRWDKRPSHLSGHVSPGERTRRERRDFRWHRVQRVATARTLTRTAQRRVPSSRLHTHFRRVQRKCCSYD